MSFPKDLNHFNKSEFENPDKMNPDVLYRIDSLREYLGLEIIITSSTGGKHSENSEHYKGNAIDFIIPDWKGSIYSLYMIVNRFGFTGLGLYPDWKYLKNDLDGTRVIRCGGFHVDVRELADYQSKSWIGRSITKFVNDEEVTKSSYFPMTLPNLIKHCILTFPKS